MLTSNSLRLIARNVNRVARPSVAVRCMSADYHDDHRSAVQVAKDTRATLNDLPVPAGSWQEYHSKRNATFNLILASGVVAVIATFAVMKSSGSLYLHSKPDLKKLEISAKALLHLISKSGNTVFH